MNFLIITVLVVATVSAVPVELPKGDVKPLEEVSDHTEQTIPLVTEVSDTIVNDKEEPVNKKDSKEALHSKEGVTAINNTKNKGERDSKESNVKEHNSEGKQNIKEDSDQVSEEHDFFNFLAIFAVYEDGKAHKPVMIAEQIPLDLKSPNVSELFDELIPELKPQPTEDTDLTAEDY